MKIVYYNDTGREVRIHSATEEYGVMGEMTPIMPLEERTFHLPVDTYPWIKMWDYGDKGGLTLLVMARKEVM